MAHFPSKVLLPLSLMLITLVTIRAFAEQPLTTVKVPYMERPANHRIYAKALLELALDLSVEKFGPYEIEQQKYQTVVDRQLLEIEKGQWLSVAYSMPTEDWLAKAQVVEFPIMRGLASYRMFFTLDKHLDELSRVENIAALKAFVIGQGRGWSTANILEQNGFQVMYGVTYETLFPMLNADRFQLLMRSIYEIEPELQVFRTTIPELQIVDSFALYTYLPRVRS